MRREELVDLNAFATVAEEESFTRAAAKLGTSQSALSHTIRRLETRLGVRLLTRTTRRVAPTQAGERLLRTLQPALDSIAGELMLIGDLREKPAGAIRVTTSEHAAVRVLWPVLDKLLPGYPDINVELSFDSGLTDIGADRFRRRRPARRAGGEGHGGRPHRARPAYGGGGHTVLLRAASEAQHAAGPGQPHLHQPPPAHRRRLLMHRSSRKPGES